jgi:hypothetical protein
MSLYLNKEPESYLFQGGLRTVKECEKRCYQVGVIERRVGKLLGRNSRAAGRLMFTWKKLQRVGPRSYGPRRSNGESGLG